jgi:DNA-binding CsgD family transcriptional regulator
VKPFEIAEAFMEQHGRGVPLPELKKVFETSLRELGFRYFACCSHVDPLGSRAPTLVFLNYPAAWVSEFSVRGRYRIDPVFRHAEERIVPFFWDDAEFCAALTGQQREILRDAAGFGICHGYTVPLHPPGFPAASCSVVPDCAPVERGAYQAVMTLASFMFDAMLSAAAVEEYSRTGPMQFSERERQCLELAAQGKDDWSIGSLLRISERTAHNHIERAKRRLGVCTRVQVIVHALSDGQISFEDVIKAETPRPPLLREARKKTN